MRDGRKEDIDSDDGYDETPILSPRESDDDSEEEINKPEPSSEKQNTKNKGKWTLIYFIS